MLYIGIDWADDHHDVAATDDTAKELAKFKIEHNQDGFDKLHSRLRALEPQPGRIAVALETSRGLLVHELLRSGYIVYTINPKVVNRYRDRHHVSGAKSDTLDARALANLLRTDRHLFRSYSPMPDDFRLLDRLCLDLRKIIAQKGRISNQITSCLKEYYPQAVGLFSSLELAINIAFLRKFPNPKTLSACKETQFITFLKQHRYTHSQRIAELWEKISAPAPVPDPVVEKACTLRLKALLDQLEPLKEHIAAYEREIQSILDKLPETDPVSSLPGVDKRLTPELVACLGPKADPKFKRFETAAELYNLAGCAPVTRSSGKCRHVNIRRACVKAMRRTFWDWAFTTLEASAWARAYYDYEKAKGKPHATILRNLGRKWAKILFVIWSTSESYNEAAHIENLKKHNVPWAIGLALPA